MMYSNIQPPSTADGKRVGVELPVVEPRRAAMKGVPADPSTAEWLQKVAEEEEGLD